MEYLLKFRNDAIQNARCLVMLLPPMSTVGWENEGGEDGEGEDILEDLLDERDVRLMSDLVLTTLGKARYEEAMAPLGFILELRDGSPS